MRRCRVLEGVDVDVRCYFRHCKSYSLVRKMG
jgi:hypothetical protein